MAFGTVLSVQSACVGKTCATGGAISCVRAHTKIAIQACRDIAFSSRSTQSSHSVAQYLIFLASSGPPYPIPGQVHAQRARQLPSRNFRSSDVSRQRWCCLLAYRLTWPVFSVN